MNFSEDQLKTFSELSHDINPLHLDEEYAHRTSFGHRVFYGCAAVIWALGAWSKGRQFQLEFLKVNFKKPLYLNEEYRVEVEEKGVRVMIKICKGDNVRLKLTLGWNNAPFKHDDSSPHFHFHPLSEASTRPNFKERMAEIIEEARTYRIGFQALGQLERDFSLRTNQLPLYQLEAITWASYLVGMQIPGRQALFTNLDLVFDSSASATGLEITALNAELHEQFKHIEISGAAKGMPSFQIVSWIRPEPIRYDLIELRRVIGTSNRLEGKTVLVTGGSRGFGSVLARGFALHGADVIINYLSSAAEAASIKHDIESLGRKAVLAQGNLSTSSGVDAVRLAIENNTIGIDLLVNNALPLPLPLVAGLSEQSADDVLAYVDAALGVTVRTSYGLIPVLKPGGTFITISTVLVTKLEPKFSAYATAKFAIEGWIRALALEMPTLNFLIVRPPRMLTDMTNTPQAVGDYTSAEIIARRVIDVLSMENSPGNMKYLEISEEEGRGRHE